MGFYPAHVVVSEARRYGVEIRGVDLQTSDVGATVELGGTNESEDQRVEQSANQQIVNLGSSAGKGAIRLGLESVRGLGEEASATIVEARRQHPFKSLVDLCQRTGLGRRAIEALIMAGALDRWNRPRRQLLWELQSALETAAAPPSLDLPPRDDPEFTAMPRHERLWLEQTYTGVTAGGHITDLVSNQLREMGATPVANLAHWPDGTQIRVGGVIVARQRPPTAKGVAFLAIEDRSGIVNVMLYPEVAQIYHRAVMSRFVLVEGEVRRDGAAMSILGKRVLVLAV